MRLLGGQRPWVIQRLTALYLLLFLAASVAYVALGNPLTFTAWRALVAQPVVKVGFFLIFSSIFLHAWIGLRDVLLDYVHPLPLRMLLLASIAAGLIALEAWVVIILAGAR